MNKNSNSLPFQIILTALIILATITLSLLADGWGVIGKDNDDVMRLIQIRDLMSGQNWFDLHQYRMGTEGGTLMHWSRIVDFPIISLILFFDLFFSREVAENLAMLIWPALCAGALFWALSLGIRQLRSYTDWRPALVIMTLILMVWYYYSPRFKAGALDHHNLQLVVVAMATSCLLSPITQRAPFFLAGIFLALSIAIGAETWGLAIIFCAFPACLWLWGGDKSAGAISTFSISFGLSLTLLFLTTTAPSNYLLTHCDSLSFGISIAAILGATGLWLASRLVKGKGFIGRLLALGVIGLICGIFLLTQIPQCLSNPLSTLPPIMHELWLDHVKEAKPLFDPDNKFDLMQPYLLGPSLIAVIIAIHEIIKGQNKARYIFLFTLLLMSLALSLYQVRFNIFAHILVLSLIHI